MAKTQPQPRPAAPAPGNAKAAVPGSPAAAAQATAAAQPRIKPIRVRATTDGFYANIYRRTGDVFTIEGETHFSTRWMEKVDPRTPEKVTGAQEALGREQEQLRREAAGVEAASVGPDVPTGTGDPLGYGELDAGPLKYGE